MHNWKKPRDIATSTDRCHVSARAGVLHVMVPGRIQLCHPEEDQRPQPQHRWTGLHGSSVCG